MRLLRGTAITDTITDTMVTMVFRILGGATLVVTATTITITIVTITIGGKIQLNLRQMAQDELSVARGCQVELPHPI